MLIYKIFRDTEWQALEAEGETAGAPVDLADGYIHFSTAAQVAETAAKHFAGQDGLWLIAVDSEDLGRSLKWEVSRGGAEFPHLYRRLTLDDVAFARPLPLGPDGHVFGDLDDDAD
ncbi:DUF952 domain-containing protein [Paracoccus sp. p4-l81]|uniref:DUF952 domain-containing protein n=1 Tax=unclassified Paracoccus (in: a-proteobacteria) TaxID=2688777 RepID=UPI0035B92317